MDKVKVSAVIKYFCEKSMSPKVIHDFIKTLGDESPSYSMESAAEFRRGRESMEDYEQSGCS